MNLAERNNFKKVFMLALTSVIFSVLFSFLSAPFLRALSVAAKPKVFWFAGIALTAALLAAGLVLASVYIGSIWVTLGVYSLLEKRGINWRSAGVVSLLAGTIFATLYYSASTIYLKQQNLLAELLLPLQQALNKAFPDALVEVSTLKIYVPGIFLAMLFSTLGMGFILEAKVNKLFDIRQTRVATALRWLEFKLPDMFVWISLFAAFFSLVPIGIPQVQKISLNITILSVAAYFFQGLAVTEFLARTFRFGPFSKMILYVLIILQLAPAIVLIGLIDYWIDFRKKLRIKLKAN